MRTIATSPSGQLLLNGHSIYLRGALDQDYYPELIYTPFSDSQLDAQFAQAQHMGLNCLRTHIKITDVSFFSIRKGFARGDVEERRQWKSAEESPPSPFNPRPPMRIADARRGRGPAM